jgi:membrane protein required for colicin V production
METIDIIICALLITGFVLGLCEGLVKQVASLAGLICGFLLGRLFYVPVGEWLISTFEFSPKTAHVTAFILILIIVPLLFSLGGWLIAKLLEAISLGWVNRVLGGVVGILKFALLAGAIITGIEFCDKEDAFIPKAQKEASILYYPLYNATGIFFNGVKGEFQGL